MREKLYLLNKKNIFLNEHQIDINNFNYFDTDHLSSVLKKSPELEKIFLKRTFMEYFAGKEVDQLMTGDAVFTSLNKTAAEPGTFSASPSCRKTFSTFEEFKEVIALIKKYISFSTKWQTKFMVHVTVDDAPISLLIENGTVICKEKLGIDLAFDFNTWQKTDKELYDTYFSFKKTLSSGGAFSLSPMSALFEKESSYGYIKTKADEAQLQKICTDEIFAPAYTELSPSHHVIIKKLMQTTTTYFNQLYGALAKFYELNKTVICHNEGSGTWSVPPRVVKEGVLALHDQGLIDGKHFRRFVEKIFCDMKKRELGRPDTTPGFVDTQVVLTTFLKHLFHPGEPLVLVSNDMDIHVIFYLFIYEIVPRYFAEVCVEKKRKQFTSKKFFDQHLKTQFGKGDKTKAYYDHMVSAAKEFIQGVYQKNISTHQDTLKEVFYLINPMTKKFSTITIISPLYYFLRGADHFVIGKTQVLDYALEHDISPLKALDTLEVQARLEETMRRINNDEDIEGIDDEPIDFSHPEDLEGGESVE